MVLCFAFFILYLWLNDERRDDAAHEYGGMLLCKVVPKESAFVFCCIAVEEPRVEPDFFEVELYSNEFVFSA